jgi:hypothetical protein
VLSFFDDAPRFSRIDPLTELIGSVADLDDLFEAVSRTICFPTR